MGTALTSSGSVVEGVPTRAPPWVPHRGAVRRLGGGYRLGGRKDGCHLVLPVKTGIHGGVTAVGTAPYVERVCSRRGPHPGPTVDTASGCGKTVGGWVPAWGAVRRGRGGYRLGGRKTATPFVLPVKTGIHGGVTAVGTAPYVERVCSRRGPHPGPTMDTASGCGKTVGGWVPDRGAVRRGRGGVRKDGCHLVLPVKTGIHGGVTAVGTALTSSGSVVEGVPTRALPWIPHRGAVRRLGGGYRLGGRKDGGGCGCSCFARVCGRGRECIYRKKGLERGDGRGRWMAGWLGWPETRAGGDGGRGDGGRGDGGRRGWADSRVHACSLIC